MKDLADIAGQEPCFEYSYTPVAAEGAHFITAQQLALHQYGMFHDMKEAWKRRLAKHPDQTKEEFLDWFIDDVSPDISMEVLEKCWDVLEKYSDTMRAAS